jgi:hypothetical protein
MRPLICLIFGCTAFAGCGGAAPLMHTAHPIADGQVTLGAGFSGSINMTPPALGDDQIDEVVLGEAATAPGFAPWVGARAGLGSDLDAGLLYTARSIRADLRHAWLSYFEPESALHSTAVSLSLGASGLLPKRDDDLGTRVGGFGLDVPLLFGLNSDADVYNAYLGARGGFEYLNGQRELPSDPLDPTLVAVDPITGWHTQIGGLIGLRVGFRYVFATIELSGDYHWASGTIGDTEASFRVFALRPAGALIGRF